MQNAQDLLAEYARWRQDVAAPARARILDLARIVSTLLRQSLPEGAVQLDDLDGEQGVRFDFEGRDYLVSFALDLADVGHAVTRATTGAGLTGRPGDLRWALVYWSEDGTAPDSFLDGLAAFGVVLERPHIDAALTGLYGLPELIRDVFRLRQPRVPLAALLATDASSPDDWSMTAAARLAFPPRVDHRTGPGITTELMLVGEAQQARPTGLALRTRDTLLVTTPEGLVEIGVTRGRAQWHLPLPGCYGTPLVRADGSVLVMCGSVLVRWSHGELTAIAGGFTDGAVLFRGPDQEAWVLSGSGVTFGQGQGTLALTRAGDQAGDQLRYPISFGAAPLSAAWLDRRRFLLLAPGHSAVVDLSQTTDAGQRDEWIPTPVHLPVHVLRTDRDTVLLASPDTSGSSMSLFRMSVTSRKSEPVVNSQLGGVFGLADDPGSGSAYLLASLPDNDPSHTRAVLMRVTGPDVGQTPHAESSAETSVTFEDSSAAVAQSARGEKRDYRLDRLPFAEEGQAQVFRAEHKASGAVVAFKRRIGRGQRDARRMKREVDVAQKLGTNPHVMPVLDFSSVHDWLVMPMAEATVEDRQAELQTTDQLRALVDAVAAALGEAHEGGWIHRDVKPSNILLLNGRWVVADWGIARRPRGQTSGAGILTRAAIGTEGFAAPELSVNGHDATPASDIYSLGQLIGWIHTGAWPQANVPRLPPPGPWYGIVRQATQFDPAHRPQDMAAFIDLVDRETAPSTTLPIVRAQSLVAAANNRGDTDAAKQLLTLAADHHDSFELYVDAVVRLNLKAAGPALLANTSQTTAVVRALSRHSAGDRGQWAVDEATPAIWWLLHLAQLAADADEWELLDASVQGMCEWDGRWDRWDPRNAILDWLRTLTGHAAATVASALRAQPSGAWHLSEVVEERRVDLAIRDAILAASASRP